jgi:hypothetical protein
MDWSCFRLAELCVRGEGEECGEGDENEGKAGAAWKELQAGEKAHVSGLLLRQL